MRSLMSRMPDQRLDVLRSELGGAEDGAYRPGISHTPKSLDRAEDVPCAQPFGVVFFPAGVFQKRSINLLEIVGEKARRDRRSLRIGVIFVKQISAFPHCFADA